jgi:hypothetical protein
MGMAASTVTAVMLAMRFVGEARLSESVKVGHMQATHQYGTECKACG